MFVWGLVPSTALLVDLLFMPYSPRWLLSKGREQEARKVLQKVRATSEVRKNSVFKASVLVLWILYWEQGFQFLHGTNPSVAKLSNADLSDA